ncbi:MAG: helix-turn-helix transcriptional regulator [Hyphomicrobiaceae bacterium]|nr:helix-turn-helix transcriptional regulator [Hyphomicrobiaceae bacterium]
MQIRCEPEPVKISARSDFARRLRELRVPRGFRTARSLARALEIDENRYTRYERAEVEPDLAMIRRICEILNVTANDLLGTGEALMNGSSGGADTSRFVGWREKAAGFGRVSVPSGEAAGIGLAALAWALAEGVTQLRLSAAHRSRPGEESPLADVGATGALYRAIMAQPFEAISSLLEDPDVVGASPDAARDLRQRIDALVQGLKNNSL